MDKWEGSYTVEAVFIMTISIFVIMSIYYAGMFMHDKATVLSYSRYQMELCSQGEQSGDMEQAEQEIVKSLEGRLFLIRIRNVAIKKQILKKRMTVNYTLSLSVPLLKQTLLGNEKSVFILEHSNIKPTVLMWDAVLLKEGDDKK